MRSLSMLICPTTINSYFLCPYRLFLSKGHPSEDSFTRDTLRLVNSESTAQAVIKKSLEERGKEWTEDLFQVLVDVKKIKANCSVKEKGMLISADFNNAANPEEVVWTETIPLVYNDGKEDYNYFPMTIYDRSLFVATFTRASFATNITKRNSIIAYSYEGALRKHIITKDSDVLKYVLTFVSEYVAKLKMDFILPTPSPEICSFCTAETCTYRVGVN